MLASTPETVNGLELKYINCGEARVKSLEIGEIDSCLTTYFPGQAAAFVMAEEGAGFGLWTGHKLYLPEPVSWPGELLLSLRVFDLHSEIHIWQSPRGHFYCRVRARESDSGGSQDQCVVDACHLLWGRLAPRLAHEQEGVRWAVMQDARGIRFMIPEVLADGSDSLYLRTRNYVDFTPEGQAGYVDCRFMEITAGR